MNRDHILSILKDIENGNLSAELAAEKLRLEPYEEFSYANVDHHRGLRQGVPEVIYGAGKTAEQIRGIAKAMLRHEDENILITRISPEKRAVLEGLPVDYREIAQIAIVNPKPIEKPYGSIVVVSAGTSDMPVAEEAAVTAEVLGNRVTRIYDSGVAGIHRLLAHTEELMQARAVVAVAGMEGALASVVGGLVDCPVIAVPTSVGYGASFHGLAALLAMLNSCASGVSVVNIDNGFGAGYQASMINQVGRYSKSASE